MALNGTASEVLASLYEKPRKYRNQPVMVDGERFDSKREAKRWGDLRNLEKAGEISGLARQVSYTLTVHGSVIGKIVPDFVYRRDGRLVCEDVKSKATITPLFRWKARHLLAEHGVDIQVIL